MPDAITTLYGPIENHVIGGTSGTFLLPVRRNVKPSYDVGFARNAYESKHPELWNDLRFAMSTNMGQTDFQGLHKIDYQPTITPAVGVTGQNWAIDEGGYYLGFNIGASNNERLDLSPGAVLPQFNGLPVVSVSNWIKVGWNTDNVYVFRGNSTQGWFNHSRTSGGNCRFEARGTVGGTQFTLTVPRDSDVWQHWVLIADYENKIMDIYRDGVLVGHKTDANFEANVLTLGTPTGTDLIGSNMINYHFSDLFAYGRRLSENEIWKLSGHGGNHEVGRGIIFEKRETHFIPDISSGSQDVTSGSFSKASDTVAGTVDNTSLLYTHAEVLLTIPNGNTATDQMVHLHRRDLDIFGNVVNDAPEIGSDGEYIGLYVGNFIVPNQTGLTRVFLEDIPLSGYINQFFIHNKLSATIDAGWTMDVRPYTVELSTIP